MSIRIVAKLGGISAKTGTGKSGKDFTALTASRKNTDGKWEDQTIFLYPEQWAQVATVAQCMAEHTASTEADRVNELMAAKESGKPAPAKAEPVDDDAPF